LIRTALVPEPWGHAQRVQARAQEQERGHDQAKADPLLMLGHDLPHDRALCTHDPFSQV
jgi:hypothetical protein